jgi:hypothetical protein
MDYFAVQSTRSASRPQVSLARVLVGGVLAALWKLGVLQRIGTTWTLIGIAIVLGVGIMISVANSGSKENVQIERK